LLRWRAVVVLPVAVVLVIAAWQLDAPLVYVTEAAIAVVALMVSSPLFAWLFRRVLVVALSVAAALWYLFSIALVGGYYGWWPAVLRSGTNFLLLNLAYLTGAVGTLAIVGIAVAVLRRPRRFGDGASGWPTQVDVDREQRAEYDRQETQARMQRFAEEQRRTIFPDER
jgi:hypothetical protein